METIQKKYIFQFLLEGEKLFPYQGKQNLFEYMVTILLKFAQNSSLMQEILHKEE